MKLFMDKYDKEKAVVAYVSYSGDLGFGAVCESEKRNIQIFSTKGISYKPTIGDRILLIPVEGSYVCAGVLDYNKSLIEGELMLQSSGGAVIHLKKNGDISLNGLIISKNGEIIPPSKRNEEYGYTTKKW